MKLNYDCARDVLLWLESKLQIDDSGHLIQDIYDSDLLDDPDLNTLYYEPEILYALQKLVEANFINPMVYDDADGLSMRFTGARGITFAGHEFLDNVRSGNVWAKTKSRISNTVGSSALSIMGSVAADIVKQLVLG